MAFSRQKMENVILFFLERINNVHLGRTKLMKLLYYVDFDHFEKRGRSITGAVYCKLLHGPVPREAERVIADMRRRKLVRQVSARMISHVQHRLLTMEGQFDPGLFSGAELQTLEKVAADWADASAAQIEAASHKEAPWAATEDGEVIDLELAHYRRPIGEEPLDKALARSAKLVRYVSALG